MPSLEKIYKDIEKLNNKLENHNQSIHYKNIGYAPRCKVCNHPDVDKIESLREDGYTYEDIIDMLDLDMSMMSLSRHFKYHYPKRTRYKLKRKKLMLESVIEAVKKYPYLEEYFKNKDYKEIKEFTEVKGFCTECFKLCDLIPPNKTYSSDELQNNLLNITIKDLENDKIFSYLNNKPDEKTIKLLLNKERCLSCKNNILTERLEILEKVMSTLILNRPNIKPNQLLYILKVKYNNDIDLFYKDIINIIEDNELIESPKSTLKNI